MGWDINAIGLKHKVDISSIESIARFLVENFKANVKCRRWNRGWNQDSTIPMVSECGIFVCEGSTREIELIEDKTGDTDDHGRWEIRFDWNPFPCFYEEEYIIIYLYEDLVNLDMVERPFRWFGFIRNFVEHETNEEWDAYCREAMEKYRNSILEYASVFGCEKVMYIADQGVDDFILDKSETLDTESLLEYVNSLAFLHECKDYERDKSIFLDVPSFLSDGKALIRQGKDVGYLDFLFDDFRDICDRERKK